MSDIKYHAGASGLLDCCTHKHDAWSPNHYTMYMKPIGITVHHMAATNFDSAGNRFSKESEQASAHYGVGPGYWCQYVSEQFGGWHAGDWWANTNTIGIETVNSTAGPDWKVADDTFDTLARLMADIAFRYGWDRLEYGVNVWGHREFQATLCPGPYLWSNMDRLLKLANKYLSEARTPKPVSKLESSGKVSGMRIENHIVTITPSKAGVPQMAHLDFAEPFKKYPTVQATPVSSVPGSKVLGVGVKNRTSKGCDVYLTRSNTVATNIMVTAIGE